MICRVPVLQKVDWGDIGRFSMYRACCEVGEDNMSLAFFDSIEGMVLDKRLPTWLNK